VEGQQQVSVAVQAHGQGDALIVVGGSSRNLLTAFATAAGRAIQF